MMILGRPVSDKAEGIISAIEQKLSKPVKYEFTDPAKTSCYGQCDPWRPEAYYIYSKESLFDITKKNRINIPFETNILHELTHLCQIEEGFPHTATKVNKQVFTNKVLYDELGSVFASSILDLNVDFRLKQSGYTSEYFYKNRMAHAEKMARKRGFSLAKSDIDFVQYACQLMCLNLVYAGTEMDNLLELYRAKNPALVNCVFKISSEILNISYYDAESCFRSLVFLFDAFNLWNTHQIIYQSTRYNLLKDVRANYPDIHTLEPFQQS